MAVAFVATLGRGLRVEYRVVLNRVTRSAPRRFGARQFAPGCGCHSDQAVFTGARIRGSHHTPPTRPRLIRHGIATAARSNRGVWALGDYSSGREGGPAGSFILHWNGEAWRVVPNPELPSYAELQGVAAAAADDAWAVGSGNRRPVIEHWDGRRWRRMPSPATGGRYSDLFAVTAPVSAGRVGGGRSCGGACRAGLGRTLGRDEMADRPQPQSPSPTADWSRL